MSNVIYAMSAWRQSTGSAPIGDGIGVVVFDLEGVTEQPQELALHRCSQYRLALNTAVFALESAPANVPVTIVTDSDYVFTGVGNLQKWASNGWLTKRGTPIANQDLWVRVLACAHKKVKWFLDSRDAPIDDAAKALHSYVANRHKKDGSVQGNSLQELEPESLSVALAAALVAASNPHESALPINYGRW